MQGGDWDRRNRLKVYEAIFLMVGRNLKKAAELLLDCIATFTCVELTSYKQVHPVRLRHFWSSLGGLFQSDSSSPVHLLCRRHQHPDPRADEAEEVPRRWCVVTSSLLVSHPHGTNPHVSPPPPSRSGPEVIAVLRDLPHVGQLLHSLYDCDYSAFFHSLVAITPDLMRDRYAGEEHTYLALEASAAVRSFYSLFPGHASYWVRSKRGH
jgi:26S proteasome regulatory subunit N7